MMKRAVYIALFLAPLLARPAVVISGNAAIGGNAQMLAGSLAAPTKAVNSFPLDGTSHVDPNITITWSQGGGATGFDVYLDAQASHNPPTTKAVSNNAATSYTPPPLSYGTIYNYRIDAVNNVGTTEGDKITFTTAEPAVVTTLSRLENSTDGTLITPTILGNGTVGDGTWTISPDPAVDLTVSTEQEFTANALKLSDESGLSDLTGTRSMRCANTANTQRAIITLGQHPKVSIGYALYLGSGFGSTDYSIDFVQMVSGTVIDAESNPPGSTNDYSNNNWQDNVRKMKAHTAAGKSSGMTIPSNGRWYWVTTLWDAANLLTTTKVYDTTTRPWTLMGTESLALESWNCHTIMFGHVDNTSGFINSPHWIDDIAIDTTGAAWPLVPDEAYSN